MKLKIITAFFCLLTANLFAQKPGYTISGSIKDLPDGIIFYLINEKDTVDQVRSKNQRFVFKGVLEEEGVVQFVKMDTSVIKQQKKDLQGERISMELRLILDNSGETIKLTGNLKDWPEVTVEGAELTQQLSRFEKNTKTAREQANAKIKNIEMDSVKIAEIRKNYERIYLSELNRISGSNVVPIVLFYNKSLTLEAKNATYQRFSERQKNSYYGKKLIQKFIGEKVSKEIGIGKVIPDFQLRTPGGKLESIRELAKKSNYTLIDFWASWCIPCRQDIPNMKKVYGAFHDKGFNIVSVSSDSSLQSWEKALKEENTPWTNGIQEGKPSNDIFGLISIPAYILLNEKAEIIQMDLNSKFFSRAVGTMNGSPVFLKDTKKKRLRGDDLYLVIEELLGKGN